MSLCDIKYVQYINKIYMWNIWVFSRIFYVPSFSESYNIEKKCSAEMSLPKRFEIPFD